MSDYTLYIELQDPYGTKLAQFDKFLGLDLVRAVDGIGTLVLDLDPDTNRDLFRLDGRLGVWRRPADGPLELLTETVFLVRKVRRERLASGERVLRITAPSATDLLRRRIVAYAAGSAEADQTDYADDMMKEIVAHNLGGNSTDSDRDWSTLLDIEPQLGLGPSVSKAFSRRNVLAVLQELADDAAQAGTPVHFDIVSPAMSGLEFRTYVNQRGVNRSLSGGNPLVLSEEAGTLVRPSLEEDYTEEATYVYAGGQGEGAERDVQEASDSIRIGASPFGRIEVWRDARNVATSTAVLAEATAILRASRPRRVFTAKIADTPGVRYGVHWHWGDRLAAAYGGESLECTVGAIRVTVADGKETITAALREEEAL